MTKTTIQPGEIVALEEGEYSDYQVDCLFRALQPMDIDALFSEYVEAQEWGEWGESPWTDKEYRSKDLSNSGFLAWLELKGCAEEIEVRFVHEEDLPSYERFQSRPTGKAPSDLKGFCTSAVFGVYMSSNNGDK